jgi:hypothetical protein
MGCRSSRVEGHRKEAIWLRSDFPDAPVDQAEAAYVEQTEGRR